MFKKKGQHLKKKKREQHRVLSTSNISQSCCIVTGTVRTGWLGIRIMCPSGAICLPADCCFSELALYNPAKS